MKININNLNRLENALETLSDILDIQSWRILDALEYDNLITDEEVDEILEIMQ